MICQHRLEQQNIGAYSLPTVHNSRDNNENLLNTEFSEKNTNGGLNRIQLI